MPSLNNHGIIDKDERIIYVSHSMVSTTKTRMCNSRIAVQKCLSKEAAYER